MAPIVESIGLNKRFGAVVAASDISISIEERTITGLIGTNGAGKTTYVNMLTGYLKPDSGTIKFRGNDITLLPPRAITRLGIARSFQIPQLFNSMTGTGKPRRCYRGPQRERPRWPASRRPCRSR